MYLKLIKDVTHATADKKDAAEEIIDCESYRYHNAGQFHEGEETSFVDIHHHGRLFISVKDRVSPQITYFDKRHTDLYIMNDNGKTIDSYTWSYDEERDRSIRR